MRAALPRRDTLAPLATPADILLGGYAFAAGGLDLAVAFLCFGWPRGELWPLSVRWSGGSMLGSALAAVGAALVMIGVAPALGLYLFLSGAMAALITGTCSSIPDDTERAGRLRLVVLAVTVPLAAVAVWSAGTAAHSAPTAPFMQISGVDMIPFVVVAALFEATEGVVIVRFWPRSQARAAGLSGVFVAALSLWDVGAIGGVGLPLIGAVTATAIVAVYIAWRMRSQLAVALQGIEGRVPGYALKHFIGAGGMAEVFLAEAVGLVGPVRLAAVKRVRRDLVDDAELCEMFMEEARLAAQLHHPNIVETYAFGAGNGRPYIAMELVDGLPLSKVVRYLAQKERQMDIPTVVEIGVGLCRALQHAHDLVGPDQTPLGVVHRDVSPHNVLLGRDGSVKLIDFGIARARTRESHTAIGKVRGKLTYAAPEQLNKGELDRRTDIFAVGVLLFELATSVRPFGEAHEAGTVGAILQGRHPALAKLRPDAGALAEPIERAMAHEPDERFDDAEAFAQALEAALGQPRAGPACVRDLMESIVEDATGLAAVSSSAVRAPAVRRFDTSVKTVIQDSREAPP